MGSPQALSESERRTVAAWAADCAERVLPLFEQESPKDLRPRDALIRARAFARGELDAAGQIRLRFVAGRAAREVGSPAARAAALAAAQAAGVAHMGAHALGTAAYAAKAAGLADESRSSGALTGRVHAEIDWQLSRLSPDAETALRHLPLLGENSSGPLGPGLLSTGMLGTVIREIQSRLIET